MQLYKYYAYLPIMKIIFKDDMYYAVQFMISHLRNRKYIIYHNQSTVESQVFYDILF